MASRSPRRRSIACWRASSLSGKLPESPRKKSLSGTSRHSALSSPAAQANEGRRSQLVHRKPPSALEHALFHATAATAATETQMWTDRYRPTKFTELVGDERVHRAALLWLKDWDACVFRGTFARADVGANARKAREREKRRKRARDQQAAWGGGAARPAGGAYGADDEQEPDRWGRPNERVRQSRPRLAHTLSDPGHLATSVRTDLAPERPTWSRQDDARARARAPGRLQHDRSQRVRRPLRQGRRGSHPQLCRVGRLERRRPPCQQQGSDDRSGQEAPVLRRH